MSNPDLTSVPASVADLQAMQPSEVDLNRVQSARLQMLLAKGAITPEQVVVWREQQGFEPPEASLEVSGLNPPDQPSRLHPVIAAQDSLPETPLVGDQLPPAREPGSAGAESTTSESGA